MKNILDSNPFNNLKEENIDFYNYLIPKKEIEGKSILDLGCGYGWFILLALKNKPLKVTGVEISNEDIKTAKKYIKDKNVEFKIGSATKIPLQDSSIDTAVSWEVIEHIPNASEKLMFQEVSRVLKPGGKFYLSTPYNSFVSKYTDPAFYFINHRHYHEIDFKEFIKGTDLKIKDIKIVGGIWYLLDLFNLYIAKWIFRREKFFEDFMREKRVSELYQEGFMAIYISFEKKLK
jgi:2-polyprenyl-3-methyl-5-hydroxy-6-metoxy-1,4-benzoquinol methylase